QVQIPVSLPGSSEITYLIAGPSPAPPRTGRGSPAARPGSPSRRRSPAPRPLPVVDGPAVHEVALRLAQVQDRAQEVDLLVQVAHVLAPHEPAEQLHEPLPLLGLHRCSTTTRFSPETLTVDPLSSLRMSAPPWRLAASTVAPVSLISALLVTTPPRARGTCASRPW